MTYGFPRIFDPNRKESRRRPRKVKLKKVATRRKVAIN